MAGGLEIQRAWDSRPLHGSWPSGRDSADLMARHSAEIVEATTRGASGRLLEVAAAEADHACRISRCGLDAVILEPSPAMLDQARETMRVHGVRVALVRGIAETLPFRDGTFDRVLCESAIDHFANPDHAVREMTRVLKPHGRLVLGVVNYGSLGVRLSRALYAAARALRLVRPNAKFFWDSPIAVEHTFECTVPVLRRLCAPYLEVERMTGVSIGWAVPGWSRFLGTLSVARAERLLACLNRVASRAPRMADYVVSVWRPRLVGRPGATDLRVTATDPAYRARLARERRYWTKVFNPAFHARVFKGGESLWNIGLTGDAERSWLADLVARGPFREAAVLGCDDATPATAWIEARGSEHLDVYELTPHVIRRVRADLPRRRSVRFVRSDLNFVRLPPARYDVIWSSGCLHHVVNLEHLFVEVERALRPGGLFAFHDYVGEPWREYGAHRLARVNALLGEVPRRFRLGDVEEIGWPPPEERSPFCGARSDEILPLAAARFDLVHRGAAFALFPLFLFVDVPALEREAPDVLARLLAAEDEARCDARLPPCSVYAVFRRR